jgi:hypothetical protein
MSTKRTSRRLLAALKELGRACPLEDTVSLCQDLTWNQVFLAIDDMSRSGRIIVTRNSSGAYWVRLSEPSAVTPEAEEALAGRHT